MFQKGTGERFKYKAEVLKHYPNAKCVRRQYFKFRAVYQVTFDSSGNSYCDYSAEKAWAKCWSHLISPQTKNK